MPTKHTDSDDALLARLRQRVEATHLQLRLGIEREHEADIFGQGFNLFHIENWYSIHALIRGLLRLSLLYQRGRRNAVEIQVKENPVPLAGLPTEFEGYTILQLSDVHLDMHPQTPHAIAEVTRSLDYDLCVITGDFRGKTFGPFDAVLDAVTRIRPHINSPVYAILGNHDTIRMVPGLEQNDIRLLLNETIPVRIGDQEIYLAGVDDAHYYRTDNIEKARTLIPADAISILLSHTPELYRHAAHAGFDLMLSGHTHGGQICLPGGIPIYCNMRAPRHLCRGAWRHHTMQGYTSRGSGVSVVDVRLNCPPEITLHRLSSSSQ
jgi:predicted MPP superfamily phosphohydrolase